MATGPVHLVGSAVGGLTALRLALSHPEITESLTIVAPPLEDEPEFVEEAFDEWLEVSGIYSLSTKKMGFDVVTGDRKGRRRQRHRVA